MKTPRSLCALLGMVAVGLVPAASGQATIQQIRAAGPTSRVINIVYLSEGYTGAQLPKFLMDVTNVVNQLLGTPPWSSYSNYFNVFAIWVASAQSGADHYTPAVSLVDTYFNSTFDSYGTQRLLTIPPNDRDSDSSHGSGKVDALLQQLMPEHDIVALIVNDTAYGGSGGPYLLMSVHTASAEIANHEVGHSFAALGDEYTSAYPGYPDREEPNTTTNTVRETIKWNAWINPATLIPTPPVSSNNAVVGLFEGAHYHTTNWFRPKLNCKMRNLGVAYCEVCAQELVLSFYGAVRPVLGFFPASTNVAISDQGTATFDLSLMKPSTNSLTVQWFTNGVAVSGANATNFTIHGSQLPFGVHSIKAVVNDPTGYVRADPARKLWDTNIWRLVVARQPVISNPRRSGTTFALSVQTEVGLRYVLEFKNVLPGSSWIVGPSGTGNGGVISLTNSAGFVPARFYRVRVE